MADYVQVQTRSLDYLERAISNVSAQVASVNSYVTKVDLELQELKRNFVIMIKEQRQQAAFQRALTEIIRVRQEVEQKFGNHKKVRDNMIGILQANDSMLVDHKTITRTSEELMLGAPKYWLAPCLVALSAWIADEKALAERAIEEAAKRDREKTCLLFALICRRNNRNALSFKWLLEYLKLQSPTDMKASVMAFIDAYTNGVFGVDDQHVCDDYIIEWMEVVKRENPEFDNEQKEYWKEFFTSIGASAAYKSNEYVSLKKLSSDFGRIDGFVNRITAVNNEGGAKDQINAVINTPVNMAELIEEIDDQMRKLVTNYEEGEETELRDEEDYLQKVKAYRGDEKRAKEEMKWIRQQRIDVPVDFVARLRYAVLNNDASLAAKKTAYFLLRDYIINAYSEYITENRDAFPEEIKLKIEESTGYNSISWKATTKNGENLEQMRKDLVAEYKKGEEAAIESVRPSKVKLFIGYLFFIIPGYLISKKFKENKAQIEQTYKTKSTQAVKDLEAAVKARQETSKLVEEFVSNEGWDKLELSEVK